MKQFKIKLKFLQSSSHILTHNIVGCKIETEERVLEPILLLPHGEADISNK